MDRLINIKSPVEYERLGSDELSAFDPQDLIRHGTDAHWVLIAPGGELVARCSLWWRDTPSYRHHRVGLIGHYAACGHAPAGRLLQHACAQLAAQHCTLAVGPMDGNTRRHYRLLIERGSEPVFFMEPDNPDDWPRHFYSCGFTPLAYYRSALHRDLDVLEPRIAHVAQRMAASNVRIRQLDAQHFDEELHRICSVSQISFCNSFLYTPIVEADFIQQYRPMLSYVHPELVLIAEHQDRPVGYLFAVPDLLQARRGQPIDTVILKTIAVLPGRAYAGLGHLMGARAQAIARELGYTRAIHALMHESNDSLNWSARCAYTIRRYALLARTLQP